MNWSIEKIKLPLKFSWKISRNSSDEKNNYIVRFNDEECEGAGEVAFNVRYGESASSIEQGFESFLDRVKDRKVQKVEELEGLTEGLDQSLRFGVESAWVHWSCKRQEKTVAQYFDIKERRQAPTSFSLPILNVSEIGDFISRWQLQRFSFLKIKVDEQATERVREVARHFSGPLRVDANEAWKEADEVLEFLDKVKDLKIEFIEQPLPASQSDELLKLKEKSEVCLIADESITGEGVTSYHQERFHGVNVKLMKAGGYVSAIKQLKKARELGMQTMLGCMVETSLGISSAMNISDQVDYIDLDGSLLLAEEPFGYIQEENGVLTSSL